MATVIATDICVHQPIDAYERAVIAANRRMASLNIVRTDHRGERDGMERFLAAIERMAPRFSHTLCSQCGAMFGAGDSGYSHCEHHQHLTPKG